MKTIHWNLILAFSLTAAVSVQRWIDNKKGVAFYQKNHFEIFDTHVFMIGNDCQTDFLMKLNI